MKQPKKPTYSQKKVMSQDGLDWKEWMVVRSDRDCLEIISKRTGERKTLEV